MEERITLCGDNCIACPRYNAHSGVELRNVAELWYKVGWRDKVVSNEEIACSGCSAQKACVSKTESGIHRTIQKIPWHCDLFVRNTVG